MTIWRMRIACWITKATHSQYAILIAFPLQQRLQERASLLRYVTRTLPVLSYASLSRILSNRPRMVPCISYNYVKLIQLLNESCK
jgi:hypothetical protein